MRFFFTLESATLYTAIPEPSYIVLATDRLPAHPVSTVVPHPILEGHKICGHRLRDKRRHLVNRKGSEEIRKCDQGTGYEKRNISKPDKYDRSTGARSHVISFHEQQGSPDKAV